MEKNPTPTVWKKNTSRRIILAFLAVLAFVGTTAGSCSDDADVASENISKDADNFKIPRRIIFINTVAPETPILVIEGFCSIADEGNQLEVTCKRKDGVIKNFLGLRSGHVTYLVEQLEPAEVSVDHYKRTFKPTGGIPQVEIR